MFYFVHFQMFFLDFRRENTEKGLKWTKSLVAQLWAVNPFALFNYSRSKPKLSSHFPLCTKIWLKQYTNWKESTWGQIHKIWKLHIIPFSEIFRSFFSQKSWKIALAKWLFFLFLWKNFPPQKYPPNFAKKKKAGIEFDMVWSNYCNSDRAYVVYKAQLSIAASTWKLVKNFCCCFQTFLYIICKKQERLKVFFLGF